MQLADELPMIYTTCIIGYTTFAYDRSRLGALGVAAFFGGLAWAITVSHGSTLSTSSSVLTKSAGLLPGIERPRVSPSGIRNHDPDPRPQRLPCHGEAAAASAAEEEPGRV
jgi:hypothetical protein